MMRLAAPYGRPGLMPRRPCRRIPPSRPIISASCRQAWRRRRVSRYHLPIRPGLISRRPTRCLRPPGLLLSASLSTATICAKRHISHFRLRLQVMVEVDCRFGRALKIARRRAFALYARRPHCRGLRDSRPPRRCCAPAYRLRALHIAASSLTRCLAMHLFKQARRALIDRPPPALPVRAAPLDAHWPTPLSRSTLPSASSLQATGPEA